MRDRTVLVWRPSVRGMRLAVGGGTAYELESGLLIGRVIVQCGKFWGCFTPPAPHTPNNPVGVSAALTTYVQAREYVEQAYIGRLLEMAP